MRGKKLKRNLKRGLRPAPGKKIVREKMFEPVIETESGIKVRSSYEKICADLLFENNIKFQYEPLMLLGGRQFRPDFYLPDFNLFIEICGYNHQPYYRDRRLYKEQVYKKHKLKAVFVNHDGTGNLEEKIGKHLEPFGLNINNQ
jgi:hypothetical protein